MAQGLAKQDTTPTPSRPPFPAFRALIMMHPSGSQMRSTSSPSKDLGLVSSPPGTGHSAYTTHNKRRVSSSTRRMSILPEKLPFSMILQQTFPGWRTVDSNGPDRCPLFVPLDWLKIIVPFFDHPCILRIPVSLFIETLLLSYSFLRCLERKFLKVAPQILWTLSRVQKIMSPSYKYWGISMWKRPCAFPPFAYTSLSQHFC